MASRLSTEQARVRLCPQVGDIRLALHDGTLRLLAMMLRQFVVIAARAGWIGMDDDLREAMYLVKQLYDEPPPQ